MPTTAVTMAPEALDNLTSRGIDMGRATVHVVGKLADVPLPTTPSGASYGGRSRCEPHQTAGVGKYRRSCERLAVLPEPVLLRTLAEPAAHGGSYSTAGAEYRLSEVSVAAMVASVDAFVGLTHLRLVGLVRPTGASMLSRDAMEVLARTAKEAPSLTLLDLSRDGLDDPTAAAAIGQLLHGNDRLCSLLLRHNELGQHTVKELVGALSGPDATNQKLREIDISCNLPMARWKGQASALSGLLRSNSTLSCFGASVGGAAAPVPDTAPARNPPPRPPAAGTRPGRGGPAPQPTRGVGGRGGGAGSTGGGGAGGGGGVMSLISMLQKQPGRLRALRLAGEALPPPAVLRLVEAVGLPGCGLTQLDLAHCYVLDAGAAAVAEALQGNTTLVRLGLGYCGISSRGAGALFSTLERSNSTLTGLSLAANVLGDGGGLILSRVLEANSVLTEVDLTRTVVGEVGVQAIRRSLTSNSSLTSLGALDTLPIAVGTRSSVEWYLRNNAAAAVAAAAEALSNWRWREGMLRLLPADEARLHRELFLEQDAVTRLGVTAREAERERAQAAAMLEVVVTRNAELVDTVADLQARLAYTAEGRGGAFTESEGGSYTEGSPRRAPAVSPRADHRRGERSSDYRRGGGSAPPSPSVRLAARTAQPPSFAHRGLVSDGLGSRSATAAEGGSPLQLPHAGQPAPPRQQAAPAGTGMYSGLATPGGLAHPEGIPATPGGTWEGTGGFFDLLEEGAGSDR